MTNAIEMEVDKQDFKYVPPPVYVNGKPIPYKDGKYTDDDTWVITLDKYERDNILALLNAIGYPGASSDEPGIVGRVRIDPALSRWNSGDWVGQVAWKLSTRAGSVFAESPNYHGEEAMEPEEYQAALRFVKFFRGKLL